MTKLRNLALLAVLALAAAPVSAGLTVESTATAALGAPRRLADDEARALLDRLESSLGDLQTLHTRFVQEKHLSVFTDVVKSDGVILYERPDKVRLEITSPFQSIIIADGKSAARFEGGPEGWRKLEAGDAGAIVLVTRQIGSWLEGRLRDRDNVYDIFVEMCDTPVVVLTPRDKGFARYISSIRLELDANASRVTAVRVSEPGGDFTLMTFIEERRNIALPAAVFDTAAEKPASFDIPGPVPSGSGDKSNVQTK